MIILLSCDLQNTIGDATVEVLEVVQKIQPARGWTDANIAQIV